MKRKTPFVIGEYYHIYNRGVDKRKIFSDEDDTERFLRTMHEFNDVESLGGIYRINSLRRHPMSPERKLVDVVCFCVNPNHFHLILTPLVDGGIEKFMQKFGNGYTKYFNNKYERSGSLFQGAFKSIHISSDNYMAHLSVYINLNYSVHSIDKSNIFVRSSWKEYSENTGTSFCNKDIVMGKFKDENEYKEFAKEYIKGIIEKRKNTPSKNSSHNIFLE